MAPPTTNTGKKSAAQIRRMKKRAEARGETYEYEAPEPSADDSNDSKSGSSKMSKDVMRAKAAKKLKKALADIETDQDLKSKERRSAKRKAEAIASEEAGGCDASELLEWYEKEGSAVVIPKEDKASKGPATKKQKKSTPYILFIGQLSYTTTTEGLFQHIKDNIGKDEKTGKDLITPETLQVRLLTDEKKNNRSRGMAFVETTNPEISYHLLKLHHTHLDGRRINVEKSAGGGKEARKEKIDSYRKEQQEYMSETVDRIIEDHKQKGELDDDELDEGVIALMKRHSANTVEIALAEYIEERGKDMENPSAYLTSIIGRVAIEGADGANKPTKKKEMFGKKGRSPRRSGDSGGGSQRNGKQMPGGGMGRLSKTSNFSKAGVDMSMSEPGGGDGGDVDMGSIFPSMSRGRGRGAYMGRRY